MSIASGYKKFKKYILTSSGFQLVSHWTKANTLEFDDGKTAQDKLGAIDGISSSRESNSDKIAASTALVSELNSDLGGVKVIPEGSGADVKYYAQLGADAASKKLLGRPEISFYDVSFSLPINSTKVINLDDYIDNGILVGALIKSFSAPWTPANQSFTSSLLNNKVSIDYRANDSGFSASLTLGLYYYVP